LFSSLLPLDNTYRIFGDTQGVQCALLASSQLGRWNGVLEAYSVLRSLHAMIPSSLLLVVCKVGMNGGCDTDIRKERYVEARVCGEGGVDEETGSCVRRETVGTTTH